LVENCSEDCEGMAVLKIGDSSSADGDDGASLFDDFEDHEFLDSQHIFGNDLTVRMTNKLFSDNINAFIIKCIIGLYSCSSYGW